MKKGVVITLGIGLYIRGLVQGYFSPMRGGWMFATALLYMLVHYFILSWHNIVRQYERLIGILILGISLIILGYTQNVRLGISALLWHGALRSVIHSLDDEIVNRKKFRPHKFFLAGGTFFSICFTLSFITAFIGRNQQFSLTCDDITQASNSVINYTEKTFNVGFDQIDIWKGNLIGNLFGDSKPDMAETTESGAYDTGSFMGMLEMYKQQLIDATVSNQKDVSQKVCQVFIDQIAELYEKPGFRVSVILLMFLFISPLLRVTLYIISGVNILIFLLLKKVKVYKVTKETVEIDKIS